MKNFNLLTLLFFGLFNLFFLINAQSQQTASQSGYLPSSAQYYSSLPLIVPTPSSISLTLPTEVDNSTQIFFPKKDNSTEKYMYDQTQTASCQNVATAFFTYTYEANRLRNLTSNTQETRYAPNFSFSHLNHGFAGWQGYTSLEKVQRFMQETGAMTDLDFDGVQQMNSMDAFRWHSGFNYYRNALRNKLDFVRRFDFGIPWGQNGNPQVIQKLNNNLIALKHYLHDYALGDANNGGVVTMGLNFDYNIANNPNGCTNAQLPPESAYSDEWVKKYKHYLHPGGHALTIVGYCDDVKFDWGGGGTYQEWDQVAGQMATRFIPDGIFSNTTDNNGDGCINLEDYEIGAVKAVNSYGNSNENGGFIWILYSYLAFAQTEWWGGNEFYALTPKTSNDAEVVFKVKIGAEKRDDLMLGYGYAPLANYNEPVDFQMSGGLFNHIYTGYYLDGGPYTILGLDENQFPIAGDFEVLFDFNYFYKNTDYGKAFFINKNDGTSNAQIKSLSLIDYRWDEEFELLYEGSIPFNVLGTWSANTVGIEYDLVVMGPQAPPITTTTVFDANMVSRFSPVFTGNQTYTINNDVRFDMYNSTITLEQGSSLLLGNNVIIRGKRGTNKLIIKGTILPMGTNVTFEAEPGSTLDVIYENPTVAGLLDKCIFNNANLTAQGGTLTVRNSTFTLLPSNKVIVKPNAKLILDASLLTKSGASQWQGIEVWGNSNQHQQTVSGQCAQGTIELTNNTIIENAYNGITNWKPNDWNSIGGIIKATGATLRNNRRSVEFMKYRNFDPANGQEIDNLSSFYGCTFEINDQYPAGAAPYYTQVSLWYVKGVKFHGCDFFNNRTNNYTGYGIYSLDAGYKILALPITPIDRPIFQNFENGIYASNSETSNTIYVNYGKFTNNGKGISLLSVNNAVVLNSLFEIGISTSCPNQGVGISMNSCTGYSIEQNTFTGGTITPGRTYAGIDITNSGIAYNEIYKNSFQNLNYGNMANQVNGSSNTLPPTGLTYLCNQNSGNKNDFYVTNNSRIAQLQKSGSAGAAANTFSNNAIYNFYNGGSYRISYSYSSGQAPFAYYNMLLVPTSVTNGCVAHYGDGNGDLISMSETQIEEKEQQYTEAFSAYNNVKAIYESLKDGGSTANTVEEITTSIPSEMWELRTKLIGDSPHLSQISLKEASLKTDVLPESVLFDILASNPDEMKDEEFLDFLKTKESPLPDYMIDLLREISGNTSYKTILHEQLNMYDIQKTTAANDVLRSVLHDTVLDQTAVFSWLDNKGDLASQYQMVDLCLQNGNTSAAQAILSTIPGLFQLSESELSDYQNFNTVKSIQLNLKNSGRNLLMLDTAEIVSLTTIANTGKGIASAQAKGILGFAIGNQYCQCTPDEEGLKHSEVKIPGSAGILSKIEINASPNPATNWVAFDYLLPENETSASLIFTDITGKTVETLILNGQQGQKVWDTRDIKSGTYIYTLKVASYTKTGKIVITK